MFKTIMQGLLAASMLAPVAAQAQDDPGINANAGISRRGELREMRERGRQDDGGADRQVQARAQVDQPRPDRPDARPDGGDRGRPEGGFQQQRGGGDGGFRQRGDARPDRNFAGGPGGQMQPRRDDDRRGDDRRVAGRPDDRGGWSNGVRNDPRGGNGGFDDRGRDGRDVYRGDPRRDGYRGDVRRDLGRGDYAGGQWDRDRGNGGGWDNRGGYGGRGDWNRGWRNDNRYNWSGYRAANRGAYHLPRYYAPRGWSSGYRRFGVGFTLNSILFNRNYWIADPWSYRLPDAYGPYRWVRYYDDALLVDLETGQVVDTVYGIFW